MDDFQFWLYIIFAVIYFISRGLKKKKPQSQGPAPTNRPQQQTRPQKQPVSFEELLKEFTDGKVDDEPQATVQETAERERQKIQETESEAEKDIRLEGRNRKFADDESKKIYEDSIKRAEQGLSYKREGVFKSKMKRKIEEKETNSAIASDIKTMLNDAEDAKKAVILSEILNRKY